MGRVERLGKKLMEMLDQRREESLPGENTRVQRQCLSLKITEILRIKETRLRKEPIKLSEQEIKELEEAFLRNEQRIKELIEQEEISRTSLLECFSTAQLEQYLTGSLTAKEQERLEAHLKSCNSCLRALVLLRDLRASLAQPEPLSPELKARFLSVITRKRRPSRPGES